MVNKTMKPWEQYPKEVCMKKSLKILKDKDVNIRDMMLEEIDDSDEDMSSESWRESYNQDIIPQYQLTSEEWNLLVYVFKNLI